MSSAPVASSRFPASGDLSGLLHRVFGHGEFRAHQRAVCEAAAAGRDVLLVMPTGAGKSLCYQLPALARGGTGLVISPLIALMDDQAAKLTALGLRVARVHSGLSREDARQACRDYLAGELDFLFIAPERMRVPGFPEMLAKRRPALIAIDEAHCISQWGHDFRPDYRTVGQHLHALRTGADGAPVIALTATATPAVQRDIVRQLELREAAVFITGFRRENLAIEVLELSKPQRAEFVEKLLHDAAARPAIVYASSRKGADELAVRLNARFPARAYHAGLEAATRERVQREFLAGKVEVVVATIAFGMGVDKADVRTVVHVALPGSVEAFYQEIGRAGRDGLASRTVLLYSFADRKTQEYLLERNYPARSELERVVRALDEEFVAVEELGQRLKLDRETLERVIEKLVAQGVAATDWNGGVRATGESEWKDGYDAQVAARREQIDRMMAFAESTKCRMASLMQHFGDTSDGALCCGLCDVCKPEHSFGRDGSHIPNSAERDELRIILRSIEKYSKAAGTLFRQLNLRKTYKEFNGMLSALERAGLVSITNDTYRAPDGEEMSYRKVSITHEGRNPDDVTLDTVWLPSRVVASSKPSKKSGSKSRAIRTPRRSQSDRTKLQSEQLFERLLSWRTEKERDTNTPASMIFSDTVLRAIADRDPRFMSHLRTVPGMEPEKIGRYGEDILTICLGGWTPSVVQQSRYQLDERGAQEHAANRSEKRDTSSMPSTSKVTAAQAALEERLRVWRKQQAQAAGLPSFFIFSDTVLREIVAAAPGSLAELRGVRGVGPEKLERFGAAVVEMCRG